MTKKSSPERSLYGFICCIVSTKQPVKQKRECVAYQSSNVLVIDKAAGETAD